MTVINESANRQQHWEKQTMPDLPFGTSEIAEICRENDVARLGVFGSVARGEATKESDIDLLVRFSKPKSLLTIIGLEEEIEAIIGRPVDLLTEEALSPYIREDIVQDLVVIYEAA
jgi:predicted nucleotidyltransferase